MVGVEGFGEEEVNGKAKEFAESVVKRAVEVGRNLFPGEFVKLEEFMLDFLPSDWEKYFRFGCDTDGGNYCLFWEPAVYKNKQGVVQFYVETWDSCEIGDGDVYIVEDGGELTRVVVSDDDWEYDSEWAERVVESAVYGAYHSSFDVDGPFGVDELYRRAFSAYRDWLVERWEFEERFSS